MNNHKAKTQLETSQKLTAPYLFTYGTFRHPYVQKHILGRVIEGQEAVLDGYTINCAGQYYDIIEKADANVPGVILPLTEEELDRADIWEDVPLYKRCRKKVRIANGFVTAIVYVKTNRTEPFIELTDYASLSQLSEEKLKEAIDACVASHPELQNMHKQK